MNIINVPTGKIYIKEFDHGKLEFLSIGDYGKSQNIKADFLGVSDEINGVPHGEVMPLQEKWVITISTQYGCSMGCTFCDVPLVGSGRNATLKDLTGQVVSALADNPDVECTKRLNVHYARMGEPSFNFNVIDHAKGLLKEVRPFINRSHVHPVVSTMMPKNNNRLVEFLQDWCEVKNYNFRGSAGLQLSINSTDDSERDEMFNGNALDIESVSRVARSLPDPIGRKYTLNFAVTGEYTIDARKLRRLFSPEKFIVKLTPLHVTKSCEKEGLSTEGGYNYYYPYKETEQELKSVGFDVLVFVPSKEEDESRITCGNALLADKGSAK